MYRPTYCVYRGDELIYKDLPAREIAELLGCAKCAIPASYKEEYLIHHEYRCVPTNVNDVGRACGPHNRVNKEKNDIAEAIETLHKYGNVAVTKNIDKVINELNEMGVKFTWHQMDERTIAAFDYAPRTRLKKKTYIIELVKETKKEKWWWQK